MLLWFIYHLNKLHNYSNKFNRNKEIQEQTHSSCAPEPCVGSTGAQFAERSIREARGMVYVSPSSHAWSEGNKSTSLHMKTHYKCMMLDPKYLSKKKLTQRDVCIRLFIAIRFITTKYGRTYRSLMGDWFTEQLWHVPMMKYWAPSKDKEDLHALSWKVSVMSFQMK